MLSARDHGCRYTCVPGIIDPQPHSAVFIFKCMRQGGTIGFFKVMGISRGIIYTGELTLSLANDIFWVTGEEALWGPISCQLGPVAPPLYTALAWGLSFPRRRWRNSAVVRSHAWQAGTSACMTSGHGNECSARPITLRLVKRRDALQTSAAGMFITKGTLATLGGKGLRHVAKADELPLPPPRKDLGGGGLSDCIDLSISFGSERSHRS